MIINKSDSIDCKFRKYSELIPYNREVLDYWMNIAISLNNAKETAILKNCGGYLYLAGEWCKSYYDWFPWEKGDSLERVENCYNRFSKLFMGSVNRLSKELIKPYKKTNRHDTDGYIQRAFRRAKKAIRFYRG